MTKASKTGAAKTGAGNTGTNNPTAASGAEVTLDPGAHARSSKPPLEKGVTANVEASTSQAQPRPPPYEALIEELPVPVTTGVDTHLAEAELEQRRKDLLEQARELSEQKRQFDITLREYNTAHDFTPARDAPSRITEVRRRGRDLRAEIDRDARSSSNKEPSHMMAEKPKYSSPAKTLRAADAARAELSG